jgi:hypothetical protein
MDHDKHRPAAPPAAPLEDPKLEKDRVSPKAPDDPEDYSDPICVCEPEPYWQEIAEQLEREKSAQK